MCLLLLVYTTVDELLPYYHAFRAVCGKELCLVFYLLSIEQKVYLEFKWETVVHSCPMFSN